MSSVPARGDDDWIAVVGLSCRVPGAEDAPTFWRQLVAGVESITRFDREQLIAAGHAPRVIDASGYVAAKGVLEFADSFDAGYFGISAREAGFMDPQHRVFLEQVQLALDDAGHGARQGRPRTGIYAGGSLGTYLPWLLRLDPALGEADGMLAAMLGNGVDYLTSRAAYKLGLSGPAVSVQTACSSSLVAVHLASLALLNGDCDMAIAGGVTVRTPQRGGHVHQPGGALSADGHCRPFDAAATGLVNGCGCGVVVLRRYADAIADGDNVRAIIRATACNNDGSVKQAFTAPNPDAQVEVIREAQRLAGVASGDIDYVEAHGTGTPLGDVLESEALARVFGGRQRPCHVGSVKANIGHLDAAAGVVSLIKTVLALEHRTLPPQINFDVPNPRCPLDAGGLRISRTPMPWPRGEGAPLAGVSSFGFGGTNVHAIVQGPMPPAAESVQQPPDALQLICVQAGTQPALGRMLAELAADLRLHPRRPWADVASTLRLGREPQPWRAAVLAGNSAAAADRLARVVVPEMPAGPASCIVCLPGGDMSAGAGEILRSDAAVAQVYEVLARRIAERCGLELKGAGAQPLADRAWQGFALECAIGRVLQERGLGVDAYLAGGTGLFSALVLAGSLTADAAIDLMARYTAPDGTPARSAVALAGGVTARVYLAGRVTPLALQGELDPELVRSVLSTPLRLPADLPPASERRQVVVTPLQATVQQAGPQGMGPIAGWCSDGPASILALWGQAWMAGVRCDARLLQQGKPWKRVSLPGYAFERRVVARPASERASPAANVAQEPESAAAPGLLWKAVWRDGELLAAPADCPRRRTVLVHHGDAFSGCLSSALARVGPVVSVKAGQPLDPALLEPQTRLVYACQHGGEATMPWKVTQALGIVRGLAAAAGQKVASFDLVGVGIFEVLGGDVLAPHAAAAQALLQVLRQEHRLAAGRTVDVDPWSVSSGRGVRAARLAVAALAADAPAGPVAWRGARRFVREMQRLPAVQSGPFFRPGAVYALFGGTGGVGLALARHLAAIPDVRLALLSRSIDEDDASSWAERIGIEPARLRTIGLDVTESASVMGGLGDLMREFGSVDGIFHLASGAPGTEPALEDAGAIETLMSAKLRGAEALVGGLPLIDVDDRPRFLALVSSLTGLLGSPGLSLYAAANAALEAYAASLVSTGDVRVVALALDRIPGVGMAARAAPGAGEPVDLARWPWLSREHRAAGVALLPGAAALDLLIDAAARALGTRGLQVQEATLLRAAVLQEDPASVLSLATRALDGSGELAVELHDAGTPGARPLARARVSALAVPGEPVHVALEPIARRCPRTLAVAMPLPDVELGPRWAALTQLRAGQDEWLAELVLPDAAREDRFPGPLHPALLDVACSAAVGACGCAGYLPVSYRDLEIFGAWPLPDRLLSHIRGGLVAEGLARFSVSILDRECNLLMRLGAYELRRAAWPAEGRAAAPSAAPPPRLAALGDGLTPAQGADALCRAVEAAAQSTVWCCAGDLAAGLHELQALMAGAAVPGAVLDATGVATVIAEVLGVARVGPDEDFFLLGGDSILALDVVSRLNRGLAAAGMLSATDLYSASTPRALAQRLAQVGSTAARQPAAPEVPAPTGTTGAFPDACLDDRGLADLLGRFASSNRDPS